MVMGGRVEGVVKVEVEAEEVVKVEMEKVEAVE